MLIEKWMPVVGFESLYEVSSTGKVKSLDRIVKTGRERRFERCVPGRMMKTRLDSGGRYVIVDLQKDRKTSTKLVHRLVATAFVPNPNRFLEVNHLDGKKSNNNIGNLEWSSRSNNEIHKYRVLKIKHPSSGITGERHAGSIPVLQINPKNNEVVKEYVSAAFAEKDGFHNSSISLCCNGKQPEHKGFRWQFKRDRILAQTG